MHGSKRLIISIISYSSNTNLTYRPGNLNLSGVLEVVARSGRCSLQVSTQAAVAEGRRKANRTASYATLGRAPSGLAQHTP